MKVGDKVVCVDASNQGENNPLVVKIDYVVKGTDYTIRGFNSIGGVWIEGLVSGYHHDGEEVGFTNTRFRKIDSNWAESVLSKALSEAKEELILS